MSVTLHTVTAGAQMCYTLTNNGTTPTRQNGTLIASNNGSVVVPGGTIKILKAFAFKSGMTDSTVTSGRYDTTDPGTAPAGKSGPATQALTPPPPRTVSYNVDPLNRHGVTDNGVTTGYTPNLLNQYTQVGSETLGYDGNFNLTGYGGNTYAFDAQNELVKVNGMTVQLVYDGLGRVLKRTINGAVTILVYDGWKVFQELNGAGNQKAWNIYGAGADEILYRNQSGTVLLYHTDKEGNVTYLLDGSGNAVEHYAYDAFGAATITDMQGNPRVVSAYGNDYMFNGKEYVTEMNLYYYCHRWYQPQLGRFLQVDPKGFDAGDENLFRYCMDDPVDKTDPDGMFGTPPEQSIEGAVPVSTGYSDGITGTDGGRYAAAGSDLAKQYGPAPSASVAWQGLAGRVDAARAMAGEGARDTATVQYAGSRQIRMSPEDLTHTGDNGVTPSTKSYTLPEVGKPEAGRYLTGKIWVRVRVRAKTVLPNNTTQYDHAEATQRVRLIEAVVKADAAVQDLASRGFTNIESAKKAVSGEALRVLKSENMKNIIQTDINQQW